MLWEATWLAINGLKDLDQGWNSYDSPTIKPEAIAAARSFLEQIASWAIAPLVVPTNTGGVQLEWELQFSYLELTFDGDTICALWGEEGDDGWPPRSGWTEDLEYVGRGYAQGLVLWIQRISKSETG